jgi:hypothetical protein
MKSFEHTCLNQLIQSIQENPSHFVTIRRDNARHLEVGYQNSTLEFRQLPNDCLEMVAKLVDQVVPGLSNISASLFDTFKVSRSRNIDSTMHVSFRKETVGSDEEIVAVSSLFKSVFGKDPKARRYSCKYIVEIIL